MFYCRLRPKIIMLAEEERIKPSVPMGRWLTFILYLLGFRGHSFNVHSVLKTTLPSGNSHSYLTMKTSFEKTFGEAFQ